METSQPIIDKDIDLDFTKGNITSTEEVVDKTKFILDFISNNKNIVLSEGGFYLDLSVSSDIIGVLKNIHDSGYTIDDFDIYGIESFLLGKHSGPTLFIGSGLSKKTEDYDTLQKGFIMGKGECFFQNTGKDIDINSVKNLFYEYSIRVGFFEGSFDSINSRDIDGKYVKVLIAREIPVQEGKPAKLLPLISIEKELEVIEDDSGKGDLHRYKCSFPQIPSDSPTECNIIQKVPLSEGVSGYKFDGTKVQPAKIKDLDLSKFIGTGVKVVSIDGIEYIQSLSHGFISIDSLSKKVNVTESPVNYDIIGPKTGSISVNSPHFEQGNGILREYEIECNSILVSQGDVAGKITSKDGNILINSRIVDGGVVIALEGNVSCQGKVLGGRVEAFNGDITLKYVENSVIVGHNIDIETAVNSIIIGDNIRIKNALGTSFFGVSVDISEIDISSDHHEEFVGITYVFDDFIARKGLKVYNEYEKRIRNNISSIQSELEKIRKFISEKGFEEHRKRILPMIQAKVSLSEKDTEIYETLRKIHAIYSDYKAQLEAQTKTLNELIAEKSKHSETMNGLNELHKENVKLNIGSIKTGKAGISNALLRVYRGHDLPEGVKDVGGYDRGTKDYFINYVSRIILGDIQNQARVIPYGILKGTVSLGYDYFETMIMALSEQHSDSEFESSEVEKRKGMRLSILPETDFEKLLEGSDIDKMKIPVVIDGHYTGYIHDISGEGIGLILDVNQKFPPVFERMEELELEIDFGSFKRKKSIVIKSMLQRGNIIRLGGPFVSQTEKEKNEMFQIRNKLELLLEE